MSKIIVRQNSSDLGMEVERRPRELPVGSELLIAFTLGAAGWWAILMTIRWIAG